MINPRGRIRKLNHKSWFFKFVSLFTLLCFTFSDFGLASTPDILGQTNPNPEQLQPQTTTRHPDPPRFLAEKDHESEILSSTQRGTDPSSGGRSAQDDGFAPPSLDFLQKQTVVKKSTIPQKASASAPPAKDTTPPKILTLSAYADPKTGTVEVGVVADETLRDARLHFRNIDPNCTGPLCSFSSGSVNLFKDHAEFKISDLPRDAVYEYWVEIVDLAGNTTIADVKRIKPAEIDTKPPETLEIVSLASKVTNQRGITLRFYADEVSTFEYRMKYGTRPFSPWQRSKEPNIFLTIFEGGSEDGEYTLEARATDKAGNVDPTPSSYTWTLDTTPPTGTVAIRRGGTGKVLADLTAEDKHSGVKEVEWSWDGVTFSKAVTFTSQIEVDAPPQGLKEPKLFVRFIDGVGNRSKTPVESNPLPPLEPPKPLLTRVEKVYQLGRRTLTFVMNPDPGDREYREGMDQWTQEETKYLTGLLDQFIPSLYEIYGEPFRSLTITLIPDKKSNSYLYFSPSLATGEEEGFASIKVAMKDGFSSFYFFPADFLSPLVEAFADDNDIFEGETRYPWNWARVAIERQVFKRTPADDRRFKLEWNEKAIHYEGETGENFLAGYGARGANDFAFVGILPPMFWNKILIEDPAFFRRFYEAYFNILRQDPAIARDPERLLKLAESLKPTVEGQPFSEWAKKQNQHVPGPPELRTKLGEKIHVSSTFTSLVEINAYEIAEKNQETAWTEIEKTGLFHNSLINREVELWVYDAQGNLVHKTSGITNDKGLVRLSVNAPFDYTGRLELVAKMRSSSGVVTEQKFYQTRLQGKPAYLATGTPNYDVFGILTTQNEGEVILRKAGTNGLEYKAQVVNGAFIFRDLPPMDGMFEITYKNPKTGQEIKRFFTKDLSQYYVQFDTSKLPPPVDTTPPTGTLFINNGASETDNPTMTLRLIAEDPGSGVDQMRFTLTPLKPETYTPWEPFQSQRSYTFPSAPGLKMVYAQYKDKKGNESPWIVSNVIRLKPPPADTVPPEIKIFKITSIDSTTRKARLEMDVVDAGSGMGEMRFSTDDKTFSDWVPYQSSYEWPLPQGVEGLIKIIGEFRDRKENVARKEINAEVPKPPVTSNRLEKVYQLGQRIFKFIMNPEPGEFVFQESFLKRQWSPEELKKIESMLDRIVPAIHRIHGDPYRSVVIVMAPSSSFGMSPGWESNMPDYMNFDPESPLAEQFLEALLDGPPFGEFYREALIGVFSPWWLDGIQSAVQDIVFDDLKIHNIFESKDSAVHFEGEIGKSYFGGLDSNSYEGLFPYGGLVFWKKVYLEDPTFFKRFHEMYYQAFRQDASIADDAKRLLSFVKSLKPTLEGIPLEDWIKRYPLYLPSPEFLKSNQGPKISITQSYGDLIQVNAYEVSTRDTITDYENKIEESDLYRNPLPNLKVELSVYDADQKLLGRQTGSTGRFGVTSLSFPSLGAYTGRVELVVKTTLDSGQVLEQRAYQTRINGKPVYLVNGYETKPNGGSAVFGVLTTVNEGEVYLKKAGTDGPVYKAEVINGAFNFSDLLPMSGMFEITYKNPKTGQELKRFFTKDISQYYVQFDTSKLPPPADTTPPEVKAFKVTEVDPKTRKAKLEMDVVDTDSGMGEMRFSIDGKPFSEWIPYQSRHELTLPEGTGPFKIQAEFRDRKGNVARKEISAEVPRPPITSNRLEKIYQLGKHTFKFILNPSRGDPGYKEGMDQWTSEELNEIVSLLDKVVPSLHRILGDPYQSLTINFRPQRSTNSTSSSSPEDFFRIYELGIKGGLSGANPIYSLTRQIAEYFIDQASPRAFTPWWPYGMEGTATLIALHQEGLMSYHDLYFDQQIHFESETSGGYRAQLGIGPGLGIEPEIFWKKVYIEDPSFFRRFNEAYYEIFRQDKSIEENPTRLIQLAKSLKPTLEGVDFEEWIKQHSLILSSSGDAVVDSSANLYLYDAFQADQVTVAAYEISPKAKNQFSIPISRTSRYRNILLNQRIEFFVYDASDRLVGQSTAETNESGRVYFSVPSLKGYSGRLKLVARTTSPEGLVIEQQSYQVQVDGRPAYLANGYNTKPNGGSAVFGVLTTVNEGEVYLKKAGTDGPVYKAEVINGAFNFSDLLPMSGMFEITYKNPKTGQELKRFFTKDLSQYYVQFDTSTLTTPNVPPAPIAEAKAFLGPLSTDFKRLTPTDKGEHAPGTTYSLSLDAVTVKNFSWTHTFNANIEMGPDGTIGFSEDPYIGRSWSPTQGGVLTYDLRSLDAANLSNVEAIGFEFHSHENLLLGRGGSITVRDGASTLATLTLRPEDQFGPWSVVIPTSVFLNSSKVLSFDVSLNNNGQSGQWHIHGISLLAKKPGAGG